MLNLNTRRRKPYKASVDRWNYFLSINFNVNIHCLTKVFITSECFHILTHYNFKFLCVLLVFYKFLCNGTTQRWWYIWIKTLKVTLQCNEGLHLGLYYERLCPVLATFHLFSKNQSMNRLKWVQNNAWIHPVIQKLDVKTVLIVMSAF